MPKNGPVPDFFMGTFLKHGPVREFLHVAV